MTNTIQIKLNRQDDSKWKEVPTKWKGKALAVHRPVVDGKLSNEKCYWTITHIETGISAATLFAPIDFVRKLSAAWDNAFSSIHKQEDVKDWRYTQEWRDQSNGLSPIAAPDSVEAIINRYTN